MAVLDSWLSPHLLGKREKNKKKKKIHCCNFERNIFYIIDYFI